MKPDLEKILAGETEGLSKAVVLVDTAFAHVSFRRSQSWGIFYLESIRDYTDNLRPTPMGSQYDFFEIIVDRNNNQRIDTKEGYYQPTTFSNSMFVYKHYKHDGRIGTRVDTDNQFTNANYISAFLGSERNQRPHCQWIYAIPLMELSDDGKTTHIVILQRDAAGFQVFYPPVDYSKKNLGSAATNALYIKGAVRFEGFQLDFEQLSVIPQIIESTTPDSSGLKDSSKAIPKDSTIGVLPFEIKGGESPGLSEIVSSSVLDSLVSLYGDTYRVIDIGSRSDLIEEQKFALSVFSTDSEVLVKIGELLSAQYIINGAVTLFQDKYYLSGQLVNTSQGEIAGSSRLLSADMKGIEEGIERFTRDLLLLNIDTTVSSTDIGVAYQQFVRRKEGAQVMEAAKDYKSLSQVIDRYQELLDDLIFSPFTFSDLIEDVLSNIKRLEGTEEQ